jgi:hypothetical protein
MRVEGELHVVATTTVGHLQSTDCWCEPTKIYIAIVKGLPGATKVVEHNDESEESHLLHLSRRERDRYLINQPNTPDGPWVTRALTPPWSLPKVPPHDPNERSI